MPVNSSKDKSETPATGSTPDHYTENGLVVFTAHFLLKRGYCCKSGCRHCPYGFEKEKGEKA